MAERPACQECYCGNKSEPSSPSLTYQEYYGVPRHDFKVQRPETPSDDTMDSAISLSSDDAPAPQDVVTLQPVANLEPTEDPPIPTGAAASSQSNQAVPVAPDSPEKKSLCQMCCDMICERQKDETSAVQYVQNPEASAEGTGSPKVVLPKLDKNK